MVNAPSINAFKGRLSLSSLQHLSRGHRPIGCCYNPIRLAFVDGDQANSREKKLDISGIVSENIPK